MQGTQPETRRDSNGSENLGMKSETIVARATPRGASALSIIRVSGPNAVPVVDSIFEGKRLSGLASHTAVVGFLRAVGDDSEAAQLIDQVVVTVFLAPHTATGEDVVEVTCHGSDVTSDEIVRLLTLNGARMAGPGEFTLRSFMNGKVDLAQAEAIGEMIHARSLRSSRISLAHLRGEYSAELSLVRAHLLELLALIELELDFSEEDVDFADRNRLEALLQGANVKMEALLASYRLGRALTEGIRVVIAGRPNAGKSTLMNALLGYERVIVSPIPGTTRDEIEAAVTFRGIPFQFVDTAGLRSTEDVIEAEGVRRSLHSLTTADLVLYLVDLSSQDLEQEWRTVSEMRTAMPDRTVLVVGNKSDLVDESTGVEKATKDGARPEWEIDYEISALSMLSQESQVTKLFEEIERLTALNVSLEDEQQVVTSQRHFAHLRAAKAAAERAQFQLASGGSGDMLSADVRAIIEHIGEITGEVTNEDVLSQIFSSFCIGK